VKKNLAAFRYTDLKVIPLYASDTVKGAYADRSLAPSLNNSMSKRILDVLFSILVVVLGLPFYLLIAAFVKLTSEGPVLFVQDRLGKDGVPFKFYKFRTMMVNNCDSAHRDFAEGLIKGNAMEQCEAESGEMLFKMKKDPRVT